MNRESAGVLAWTGWLIAIGLALSVADQPRAQSQEAAYWLAWEERTRALVDEKAEEAIQFLVDHQEKPDAGFSTTAAIRGLGKLRSPEAVPILLQYLTFVDAAAADTWDDQPPAVRALVQIGSPAIDWCLARLTQGISPEEVGLILDIIERVYGHELAVAHLEVYLRQVDWNPARGRVKRALKLLKSRG